MARWVHLIQKRSPGGTGFLFDAGNFVSGSDPEHELQMRHMVKAMGALDYDAVNLTLSDFELGLRFLQEAYVEQEIPFVSTNLYRRDTGEPLTETSRVIERGGVRVGVLGLCAPEVPEFAPPGEKGLLLEVREPIAAARAELSRLEGSCDLVVALTNMSFPESVNLARKLEGIDFVIVCGVEGEGYEKRKVGERLVIKVRDKKYYLGNLEVTLTDGGGMRWTNPGGRRVPTNIPLDQDFKAMFYVYQIDAKEKGLEITGLRIEDDGPRKVPRVDAAGRTID